MWKLGGLSLSPTPAPGLGSLPCPRWHLNLCPPLRPPWEIRGPCSLSPPLFLQAFLHRIRQNVADSVDKGLTEENVKVRIAGPAPLQIVLPPRALLSTAILPSRLLCARLPGMPPAENPFPAPWEPGPSGCPPGGLARAPALGLKCLGRAVE